MSWISRPERQVLPLLVIVLCIFVFQAQADEIARRYQSNQLLIGLLPGLSDQPAAPDWPTCPGVAGSEQLLLDARHLVEQAPDDARAWRVLAQAQWLVSQCDDAIRSWQRSLEYQWDPMAAYHLGLAYLATQEWELAVSSFQQADLGSELANIAQHALDARHPKAMRWLELSVDVQPQKEVVEELAKRQSPEDAASTWRKLFEAASEDDPDHWWALGEIAALAGNIEQALTALQQGEALAADPSPFITRQARLLVESWDIDGAIAAYQRDFYLGPAWEKRWSAIRVGELYQKQGKLDEALTWFRLDPAQGEGDATYRQGVVLKQMGRLDEAKQAFRRAEESFRGRTDRYADEKIFATYWLAQAIYQQSRVAEAIPLLKGAIALSGNWGWNLELGHWYRELGELDRASEAYQLVLQHDPSHGGALQALQELDALSGQ